ncbi:GldG family protein [Geomesophilobacter sediminis]|nr:GldG family protein [Geomesophilobacter sediminis]
MCILVLVVLIGMITTGVASAQTVMFDNSHGERFSPEGTGPLQLSGLAGTLQKAGARVVSCDTALTDATLKGVDGLIISGAFRPFNAEETDAVVRFLLRGGKVAIMLHIAPPLEGLLQRLEVAYTNGVIHERENIINGDPMNFRVTNLGSHPVLKGVETFSLYGVWGVKNTSDASRVIAATGPNAWIDLDGSKIPRKEATGSFGVAVAGTVGSGGFIVFGDDAIFQNKFLDRENQQLATNLAGWLK